MISAPANDSTATPSTAGPSYDSAIQPDFTARSTSFALTHPTRMPATGPSPICISPKTIQLRSPSAAWPALARLAKSSTIGNAMPSFRPLSMFNACRIRPGTTGLVTTDWPSAASVGARIAANSAASHKPSPSGSASPTSVPAAMIRGMPPTSIRTGRLWSRRTTRRSIRAASENSTRMRVTSASPWMKLWLTSRSATPKPASPMASPNAVNSIGPVTSDVSRRREMRPNRTMPVAMTAKP